MATNSNFYGRPLFSVDYDADAIWDQKNLPVDEPTLELAQGEEFDPGECVDQWAQITITDYASTDNQPGDITWVSPNASNTFTVDGNSYTGTLTTTDSTTTTDIRWSDMNNSLTWGGTG